MIPRGYCQCGCGEKTPLSTKTWAKWGWVKGEPLRYIKGHNNAHTGPEYIEHPETGCWEWQHSINAEGYARERGDGTRYAHRRYYEQAKGPIPEGFEIDHLCRNRRCVNPDHLEVVTRSENLRRGEGPAARNRRLTHCKRGHPLSGDNLYVVPATEKRGARRFCKACMAIRRRVQRAYVPSSAHCLRCGRFLGDDALIGPDGYACPPGKGCGDTAMARVRDAYETSVKPLRAVEGKAREARGG